VKRIASAALLLLLASTLFAADTQRQAVPASIQGTVHTLRPETGSLDVVTGVGMALRIVRVAAPPSARIVSGDAGVPLSALKRGDIVRMRCRLSGEQLVADHIEKVVPR
jgi:uncharacterized protein (DUF58 family)